MDETESPKDRQENEIEALKAIFAQEIRDLRDEAVGDVWHPTNVVITLTPQKGSSGNQEVYAHVDLHIMCCEAYPEIVPTISLENSKGLSIEKLGILLEELQNLAQNLIGEVMIFELAQHVQQFLHDNNKPGFKSFYDEMLLRQQLENKEKQLVRQRIEDRQREAILDEVERKKEVLRAEEKRRKREVSQESRRSSSPPINKDARTSESSDCACEVGAGTLILTFNNQGERKVHRGKHLGRSNRGSVCHCGIDLESGELFTVVTWVLKGNINVLFKQVSSVEQEVHYLQRFNSQYLVRYINIKYSKEKDHIILYLLQEFVFGTSLDFYLRESLPMEPEVLRHCASGVLHALQFLHRNNVVHRDLRTSSVFLNNNGLVVVADYSIDRRLYDIQSSAVASNTRVSKKSDIHQFGVMFLSLLKGKVINHTEAEVYRTLSPPEIRDFFERCLVGDEQKRWSATQLLEHSFIKTPVGQNLSPNCDDNNQDYDNNRDVEEPDNEPAIIMPANIKGQSRIQNEFEVLKWLGRGAFGDVLKVKNKLDGGVYAIKRIELNPQNKQLNRKITREVKLLSRLNHENVVRYFNSWIECVTIESPPDNSSSSLTSVQSPPPPIKVKVDPLSIHNQIELLAPPVKESSVEWSVSVGPVHEESASSDDSSDEEDWMGFLAHSASSDEVVFEQGGSTTSETNTESKGGTSLRVDEVDSTDIEGSGGREVQFMYIQMEFCEKSTLRTAIDAGLCDDEQRVWRLFREVVEGLAHIHEQGMIHRDLKPVNIFLDSNDHVKIGDFGLATTNILQRPNAVKEQSQLIDKKILELRSFSQETGDESLTGHVGTALYVAPELTATHGSKLIYNQKVDIYSLGIIFFEMCYPVRSTNMERVSTLLDIRKPSIVMPKDFTEDKYPKQVHIVRWLLTHDPAQRPSSQELLLSSYLPPPQLEEAELQEMVRHTLSNPQSKAYKYLIGACFRQDTSQAEHITYYMNIPRGPSPHLYEMVKENITQILKRHGGIHISTPLLSPPSSCYEGMESYVRLVAHSGSIIGLPHDLRVPFARYVARSGTCNLRRYAIERVYREKKVFGFHPRELYECAFDIVTPSPGNLVADAELLAVSCEVLNEFPSTRDKSCIIKLNHMSLLHATLLHCGIENDKHDEVYAVLSDRKVGDRHSMLKIQTRLSSLYLSEQLITNLLCFIELEGSLSKMSSIYKSVTKRKGEAASLATQGLHELETIIRHAESFGVKCNIVIAPGLVYNSQQYSGMIFQVLCDMKKKRKHGGMEVVAAGGRYDDMLLSFRKTLELSGMVNRECSQSAVGVSISLDRIVSALQESQEGNEPPVDVVVCSLGRHPMIHEKCTVVRDLWASGVRAVLLDTLQTLEEVQDFCIESAIPHIILLKDSETTTVRIRSWDKEHDRFQEKTLSVTEIAESFQRLLMRTNSDSGETVPQKTDNRTTSFSTESSSQPLLFITFITIERMNATQRRRSENQITSQMHNQIQRLSSKVRVEVLALSVDSSVIRTLATHLELNAESSEFRKNVLEIIEKHPRYKKYLTEVCDKIDELRSQKVCPNVVVYSLPDTTYKLLT